MTENVPIETGKARTHLDTSQVFIVSSLGSSLTYKLSFPDWNDSR